MIFFPPLAGIKSATHVVVVALKRAPSDLSAHQKKILQIDDHCGIAIAGLTADARILSRFMRMECLNERYAYDRPMPVTRLVGRIGAKSQIPTQVTFACSTYLGKSGQLLSWRLSWRLWFL